MRIFISNQASDQYVEEGVLLDADADNLKCPSWTLKIEGRMLDNGAPPVRGATPRKFSHFCKSVLVELLDSTSSSADSNTPQRKNVIEWHNQPGSPEVDGFEIKRKGDADIPVKIYIYLANSPEKFKLAPKLASLLDIHTDTKVNLYVVFITFI
jgi:SWI/SNF-related matrix-associated actin-dependent regulator of chromatin subfamily D